MPDFPLKDEIDLNLEAFQPHRGCRRRHRQRLGGGRFGGVNVVQGHTYATIGADADVTAGYDVEVRAIDDTELVDFIGALPAASKARPWASASA